MKIDDEFYVILLNDTDICYGGNASLAIYPSLKIADDIRIDLHLKFPSEDYKVKKNKIEIE